MYKTPKFTRLRENKLFTFSLHLILIDRTIKMFSLLHTKKIIILLILLYCLIDANAQPQNIKAKLIDSETGRYVNQGIIVNKRTNYGFFVDLDGTFKTDMFLEDTLLISSSGYALLKVCFKDSIKTAGYIFQIRLSRPIVELKSVEIKPRKSLVEIQDALKKIKTPQADKMRQYEGLLGAMSALQSPITYMYMQFSRMERSKRLVEELVNNDNRMELMRELMRSYLIYNLIDINDAQLDDFIQYCRISDEFIKQSTEYELAVYIKKRYEQYMEQNDYVPGR